jgi:hypothetical protein
MYCPICDSEYGWCLQCGDCPCGCTCDPPVLRSRLLVVKIAQARIETVRLAGEYL